MPRGSGDVVVRVDSQTSPVHFDRLQSISACRMPSPPSRVPSSQLPRPDRAASRTFTRQQTRLSDESNDAIWEELANSGTPTRAGIVAQDIGNSRASTPASRRPSARMSFDDVPAEFAILDDLGHGTEPQRRSTDNDIHLNEPNIVLLQEKTLGSNSRRLSQQTTTRNFSVGQNGADAVASNSPPRVLPDASATSRTISRRAPSPLQPHSPPVERVQEEDEAEMALAGADAEALKRSDSRLSNVDVKLQLPNVYGGSVKTVTEDEIRRMGASAACSPQRDQKVIKAPSLRRVALSKKSFLSKTKSRLIEPPQATVHLSAPAASTANAKSSVPSSPARPSYIKGPEAEADDEDPFKDIEFHDKFRQGNLEPITLIQWAAFFIIMGCLICTLTVKQVKGRNLWQLELWKWFLLGLVVLCGRLVSGWLIRIVVIIFENNFLLRKKVLYFVYGLRKAVQNCLWLGLVLMAWKLMFDSRIQRTKKNHKVLVVVTELLECFVIAAFIWLVKLLLVKSLASSFHVSAFFDRIQESLYNQHVLEKLLGPPVYDIAFDLQSSEGTVLTVSLARGGAKNSPSDPAISIPDLQKVSQQNVSAGLMKGLMTLVTHPGLGTLVTTIDESVCVDEDGDGIEINSELEAKAAGKLIFRNVAQEGQRSILREDLLRFLPVDDVPRVLCLFEGAKDTQRITKKALKNWVVNVYHERRALAHSLNDTKTAVKGLHRMASVVVIIIIIVVWLLVLGIATTHVLLFITSQLLLVGFIFSNTVKQVFEAIIFLFVMHPFDVGDRCIVDGSQLIVEEMKILSTVFLKPDNEKVFYPNAVLATKPISNLYRSPDMRDFLEFSVHISTSVEKITTLKERIQVYVDGKSEHWQPKFTITVKEIEDLNRMRLSVSMQHTINFQNNGERLSRRSDLLLEIKRIFADLGVEYQLLLQPVQLSYHSSTYDSVLPSQLPPLYPTRQ